MGAELNKLVDLVFRLDQALKLNASDSLLYHQSRFWLFRHFQQNAEGRGADRGEPVRGLVSDLVCFLISAIRILAYRVRGRSPVLIIEHLRYRGYEWSNGDPYFGVTEAELTQRGTIVVAVGLNHGNALARIYRGKNVILVPRLVINLLRFILGKLRRHHDMEVVGQVVAHLEQREVHGLLSPDAYVRRLQQIRADNVLLGLIVKWIRPRALLCADGYNSNSSFILNANRLGIPTIEYQHGIISEGHVGYNFGSDYVFPDMVMPSHYVLWGEFWKSALGDILTRRSDIRVGTYEYGQWWRMRVSRQTRPVGILFIMQPSAAAIIEERVRQFRAEFPEVRVGVRYHPKQKEKMQGDLVVEHHFNESIYDLFMSYQCVIGCFSTALFEAAAMQRQVFFMPFPGFTAYEGIMKSAGIRPLAGFGELMALPPDGNTSVEIVSDTSNMRALEDLLL
jgi:hypothetical protein